MEELKAFRRYINESTDVLPDEVEGNNGLIFKKQKESENARGSLYFIYYKGYNIEFGGRRFGTLDSLNGLVKDYVISDNLYNKIKHYPTVKIGSEESETKLFGKTP